MDKPEGEVLLPYSSWIILEQRSSTLNVEVVDYVSTACDHALTIADAFLVNYENDTETYLVLSLSGQAAINVAVNPRIPAVSKRVDAEDFGIPDPFIKDICRFQFPSDVYEAFSSMATALGISDGEFLSWSLGIKDLIDRNVALGKTVFVNDGIDGDLMLAQPQTDMA